MKKPEQVKDAVKSISLDNNIRETSLRILLVEDNPGDVYIVKDLLKSAETKYIVTHSSRLSDALQLLNKQEFDAILLDIGLPDSTGIETLRKIKSPKIKAPIIILTGFDDKDLAIESVKEGAQDYLVKNKLSSDNISRAINHSIERKKLQEIQKKSTHQFSILSSATTSINSSENISSIQSIICNSFKGLLDDAAVAAIEITDNKITHFLFSEGPKLYFNRNKSTKGLDIYQTIFNINDNSNKILDLLSDEKLHEIEGGIYELALGNLKKEDCTYIEKMLDVKRTYAILFLRKEKMYGCAVIFTKKPIETGDISIIEAISSQITLNINRKFIENNIKLSEKRYKDLFTNSPVSKLEEDYSEVKKEIDKLKKTGHCNIGKYLWKNPDKINEWILKIKNTDFNQAALELHKADTKEQFINKYKTLIYENSQKDFIYEFSMIFDGKLKFEYETEICTISGEKRRVIIRWSAVEGYKETLERVLVSIIDITEIKKAEEDLRKLNEELEYKVQQRTKDLAKVNYLLQQELEERVKNEIKLNKLNKTLRALSRSSQAMMRAECEYDYIKEICKIIVEDCGHSMVWVGYAGHDEDKTVKPIAHSGFEEGYLEKLNVTWADNERGRGPTGTAIRTEKPAMCKNMLTDETFKPWREEAIKRGYASSIAIPFSVDNETFGAITIYSKEPDPFSEGEVNLLLELANDLAHGITVIKLREAQMKAEEALRESEEKYRLLFNKMIDGFALHEIILDGNGKPYDYKYISINPAFEELTGLKSENVIGKKVSEVIPTNEKYWIDIYGSVALTGENIEFENYSSETKKYFKVNAFCPKKGLFAIILENITFKKQAEQAINESEEKYRQLTERSNALICEIDIQGKFTYINSKFKENLDYAPEDLIGHPASEICHPDLKKGFLKKLKGTLKNLEPQKSEWIFKDKSGNWRWFSCYSNTFVNSKGETHISVASFDITEKKNSEKQLKKYAADLKNLNMTKDKFFGIIAHDLKNPFSSMLGASELLSQNFDKYDAERIKKFSLILNDSAKSGYALLENLLEWSRSQTGNLKFNPEKINILKIIEGILSNIKISAANKNIKLHSEIKEDLILIADKNMLNTILRNLLNNAIKFTHKGGNVFIKTENNNNSVTIAIKDDGIGIAKENINKLFRIDTKFCNIGTAEERGTGLGLLLCKEFVEKHGGNIWVESELGKGSEFKFTIPLNS
ncbi:MAG: PAS domain S-box protein [Bacteroidales bacterium]|jgi:PAS domain S-box-containing protein